MNPIVSRQYAELVQAVAEAEPSLAQLARGAELIADALQAGGKVLTAGNGGSAADALHMAEELIGRYRTNRAPLPAVALAADATALTCIGNDFGFEHIFSRQVQALGQEGDLLVLFSTSGNSQNLIEAAAAAKAKGVKILSLSGKSGGKLAPVSDLSWIVPSQNTARIQELHTWAMHCILECVEVSFPIA